MKTLVITLIVSTVLLAMQAALCHDGRGGLTLEPQLSTRAVALGETGLVETGSAEAFAANPSCLPVLSSLRAGVAHGNMIEGISSSATCVSVALPFGPTAQYPGIDGLQHKYGIGLSIDHKGFELAQGSSWSCEMISVGFGYSVAPFASLGILSKMLFSSSDVDDAGVKAYGIDIGSRLELKPGIDVGLVIRNLGGSATWDGGEDEAVPVVFNLGGAVTIPYDIRAELAMGFVGNGGSKVGLGIDVPILKSGFHVRGGYARRSDDYGRDILTAGFGFKHLRYRLAYAVRIGDEDVFGLTHHFSLSGDLR
jgi:hypothetical protein